MIFYFSGTGNSRWVAEQLSQHLGDSLVAISQAMAKQEYEYTLAEGEMLGFVFPTYSWGPAPVMVEFVKKLKKEISNVYLGHYVVLNVMIKNF